MSKYQEWLTDEKLTLIKRLASEGLDDEQIADTVGIDLSTYYDWQFKYIEFLDAIKNGKGLCNAQVQNALFKRAVGYEYEENALMKVKNTDGSERVEVKKVKKIMHGDVTAQIFWLKKKNT